MINAISRIGPDAAREFPLSEAPESIPLRVIGIQSGHGAQSRLASMGILPGEIVKIVRKGNGGPLLVEVKGTRVALGRGISLKVIVTI
ncbi:MAG: FeoA family protein [bacterium]